ncbi:Ribosomal protein S18 acetylase RimI [Robiginitalea myxolifaciens]|uniref:Ribosomal protein S18 acetylase RimI n=1 Tax=Robiginitalea myxolifaciens TaxID=400055 RepID=A0A1I6G1H1_9FLAO|nr:GNAT family N-acetyltransferase [Robiginitalea myxolifaciens]SFR35991.1 Ribosomal protein S18 acetylase RimI [Robiginitalea myxolifaciens]
MNPLSLIPVSEDELEDLRELSIQTFTAAFGPQNDPADFQNYLQNAFSREQLTEELHQAGTTFYFLREAAPTVANNTDTGATEPSAATLGYLKLNTDAAQSEPLGEEGMEVERIYVRDGHQGKGLGQWMIERSGEMAKKAGKSFLWLGVWQENTRAVAFYQRMGFVIFGEHPYYIGSDRQMDWLMRLDL